jgi:hypothetical protein
MTGSMMARPDDRSWLWHVPQLAQSDLRGPRPKMFSVDGATTEAMRVVLIDNGALSPYRTAASLSADHGQRACPHLHRRQQFSSVWHIAVLRHEHSKPNRKVACACVGQGRSNAQRSASEAKRATLGRLRRMAPA